MTADIIKTTTHGSRARHPGNQPPRMPQSRAGLRETHRAKRELAA
jgi:hypothetical protein